MHRSPVARIGCALIALVLCWPGAVARAQGSSNEAPFRFGPFERELGRLADPSDLQMRANEGLDTPIAAAITRSGEIWVLDAIRGRLHIYSRNGEKRPAPRLGLIEGLPIARASAFSFSPDESRLAIADASFDRVVVIDPARRGDVTEAIVLGKRGTKPGEFCHPSGVAWLDDSTLIIADRGNDRLQIMSLDGEVKTIITGSKDAPLVRPGAIAVDVASQRIAVVEPETNRVRVFDSTGTQTASWGDWGPFPGLFDEPVDAQWQDGRLSIVDRRNHRVQSFKPDGSDPQPWGQHELVPHEGEGRLHYPDALAIAPDGSFGVIVESIEDRVQIFDAFNPVEDEIAAPVPFDKTKLTHLGEFADADGNLMVAIEPENHFVFVFDLEQEVPIILNKFGERGEKFGLLVRPTGIDLDFEKRSIMLVDPVTRRLSEYRFDYDPRGPLKFHPDMTTFARSIDLAYLEEKVITPRLTWPIDPGALERDGDGRIYLADKRNGVVLRFAPDFSACETIGSHGWKPSEFMEPTDIAVTEDGGTIVVVDGVMGTIRMYGEDGQSRSWPKISPGPDLGRVTHVALGSDNRMYVSSASSDQVIAVDFISGAEVGKWGGRGDEMGQLWKPADLVVDRLGRVVVIDQGNHRAQIFSNEGEWLITFGAGRAYTREHPPAPRRKSVD